VCRVGEPPVDVDRRGDPDDGAPLANRAESVSGARNDVREPGSLFDPTGFDE